jgi:hypothetical protein
MAQEIIAAPNSGRQASDPSRSDPIQEAHDPLAIPKSVENWIKTASIIKALLMYCMANASSSLSHILVSDDEDDDDDDSQAS